MASAPTNLMAVQEGPTSIRVSWTPPTPLGDTTGYRIYYSGGSSGSVDISGVSTDSYLLIGLQIGASYTISIVGTSQHLFSDRVEYPNITLGGLLQWRSTGACAMIKNLLPIMCHDKCTRMTNDTYLHVMDACLAYRHTTTAKFPLCMSHPTYMIVVHLNATSNL